MSDGVRVFPLHPLAHSFARLLRSEYIVLVLTASYFAAACGLSPDFLTVGNLRGISFNMLPLLAVAVGQTVVLIAGGIDLSVTSIIALSSITGAAIMNQRNGVLAGSAIAVPAAILAMLGVGLVVGLLNGLAVSRLRMPAFMVTLTSMMFFSGLAVWLTQSRDIYNLPESFTVLSHGQLVFVSYALILSGTLALLVHIVLSRTLWGRWTYAVGHNMRSATISGVPAAGTVTFAYALSGFCAAVGSILYTARLETGSPVLGQRILLDVIGAVVIGGTSLFGGKGKILWTAVGVLLITMIDNSLNLLGLTYFAIMIAKGGVILLAALIDALRYRLGRGA